jgi:hypothetical protein
MGSRFGRSEAGNIMLTAMIVAAMVVVGATSAYHRFGDTKDSFRTSRIKSLMTVLEAQVRNRARQPEAYTGCVAGAGCETNPNFFADIQHEIISGAVCPPGQPQCGIVLTLKPFQASTFTFQAVISYEGKEIKPKPLSVSVVVPLEVLQADVFSCGLLNPDLPVFTGFTRLSGQPICKGFNSCGAGQFVSGVNVSTRTLKCKPLPSTLSCSPPQMVSSLVWAGDALSVSCSDRPDPPFDDGSVVPPVACPTQTLQDLYDTAVKTFNPSQGEIAANCIDIPPWDSEQGNLTLTDQFSKTRFAVTCASRWCNHHSGDLTSVGYIPSALAYEGDDSVHLDPSAAVTLECFTNHVQGSTAACQTVVDNNPPLSYLEMGYGGPNCEGYCGCDLAGAGAQFNAGPAAASSCGTRYCQSKDFKWGVLSEMNNSGIVIRCSKSKSLY